MDETVENKQEGVQAEVEGDLFETEKLAKIVSKFVSNNVNRNVNVFAGFGDVVERGQQRSK